LNLSTVSKQLDSTFADVDKENEKTTTAETGTETETNKTVSKQTDEDEVMNTVPLFVKLTKDTRVNRNEIFPLDKNAFNSKKDGVTIRTASTKFGNAAIKAKSRAVLTGFRL
jgi:hypothetical protein